MVSPTVKVAIKMSSLVLIELLQQRAALLCAMALFDNQDRYLEKAV
jgi:hypothetical protein